MSVRLNMRVMIIDDHAINRELCRIMLSDVANDMLFFEDGQGVIEALSSTSLLPDIILLDVLMPIKDGFTTAKEIRAAFPNQHIPILFLTALDDQDSFAQCLSLGDDFIPKPIEKKVLLAKINAHFRIAKLHQELALQHEQLKKFQEQVQYDYQVAESIFSNIVDEMNAQTAPLFGVDYISTPETIFNGSLILIARRRYGGIYVLIAESNVKGLPAAIANIPATRTFFSLAQKGCSLSEMVSGLNRELYTSLPHNIHLAASVFEVHSNGFEISWWGGGMPTSYILTANRQIAKRLRTVNQPLGELPSERFQCDIKHFKLLPEQSIVCFTPTLLGGKNLQAKGLDYTQIEQCFVDSSNNSIIAALRKAVSQFNHNIKVEYFPILTMSFPIIHAATPEPELRRPLKSIAAKNELYFPALVLKDIVLMNEVRSLVKIMISDSYHLDCLCSILSELFNKVIEQGLLGLKSELKNDADGFILYHQQREEGLAKLADDYWVRFQIQYVPDQQTIEFIIEHNGQTIAELESEQAMLSTSEQDLLFAIELCDAISFTEQGLRIKGVYRLDCKPESHVLFTIDKKIEC